MRTDLFDFDLPADRIALRPASPRDSARLLVVRPGQATELDDRKIADLPDLLQPGDCLVVNDSKVIAARLKGRRIGRGEPSPRSRQPCTSASMARIGGPLSLAPRKSRLGTRCDLAPRAGSASSGNSMLKFHIKMREGR